MSLTSDQFKEMQERVAKNRRQAVIVPPPIAVPSPIVLPQPVIVHSPVAITESHQCQWPAVSLQDFKAIEFVYKGKPIGKPRQTQRDQWQKRPCVLRYRAFADAIREAAGQLPPEPDIVMINAYVPMPSSWTKTKKHTLLGRPCRQKPDFDNIAKAVCDALFEEDACIWLGLAAKYWCLEGDERLELKVLYAKSN